VKATEFDLDPSPGQAGAAFGDADPLVTHVKMRA
jgi:hypothetical protein